MLAPHPPTSGGNMRRLTPTLAGVLALSAVLLGVVVETAGATYPGAVGRIAFGMAGPQGNGNIYSVLPNGHGLRRLTDDPSSAAYSPHGRQIAFCSDRTGAFEIWAMNQNGTGQHAITKLGGSATFPDYSPDGRQIAFTGDEGTDPHDEIYAINANGTGLVQLTHGPGDDFGTAWSPDGRQIAFARDFGKGNRPVYVMNADGSDQHPLHPGGKQYVPAWQPLPRAV